MNPQNIADGYPAAVGHRDFMGITIEFLYRAGRREVSPALLSAVRPEIDERRRHARFQPPELRVQNGLLLLGQLNFAVGEPGGFLDGVVIAGQRRLSGKISYQESF